MNELEKKQFDQVKEEYQKIKNSNTTLKAVIFILIIVFCSFLGFKNKDSNLDEDKVNDYIRENYRIDDVLSLYHKQDKIDYIYNHYTPTEIYYDLIDLKEFSWGEIMAEGFTDKEGKSLESFFNDYIIGYNFFNK